MKFSSGHITYLMFILLAVLYVTAGSWVYPMQGDDFSFCAALRDNGFAATVWNMYLTWTLRTGEVFNFLLLYGEKIIFNILNPLIQLFLVWSLFLFGFRKFPDWKNSGDCRVFAFLLAVSCFCAARPRDTVYWMTGAMVYSFGCALWFTFWGVINLPRPAEKKRRCFNGVCLFLLGTAAACSIENAMAAGLLLLLWHCIRAYRRKEFPPVGNIVGLSGYLTGAVVSATAPGRWARAANEGALSGIAEKLSTVWEVAVFWGGSAWFALLLLFAAGVVLFIRDRNKFKEELPVCGGLLALSILADAAFVAGGVTPAVRAYLFSSLLIALAAARMLESISGKNLKDAIAGLAVFYALILMATAVPDFLAIREDSRNREDMISRSSDRSLTVPAHRTVRRSFLQYIWIEDHTEDPSNPFNQGAAKFYRLDSIRIKNAPETVLFWKNKQEK